MARRDPGAGGGPGRAPHRRPVGDPRRVEAVARDPAFPDTTERLAGLETDPRTPTWHDIVHAGGRLEAWRRLGNFDSGGQYGRDSRA
jgi:hypothetical protein